MSNALKLNWTKTLLQNFCKGSGNKDALEMFEKEDVMKLNKKIFYEILYFLIKMINENYLKTLPWPVINKKMHDTFILEVFKIIDQIRSQHTWTNIPHYQRSHFLDPRPENDKAVEFLWSMTSLTAHILADVRPNETSIDDLKKNLEELKADREEKTKELESIKNEQIMLEETMKTLSSTLEERKQELIDEDVITANHNFTLPELFKEKEKLERTLLNSVLELNNQTRENFVLHL